MTPQLRADLIATGHAMADAARAECLRYFRQPDLDVANKADGGFDPVTAADRAAEMAMRAVLAARRPGDGIAGEEFDPIPSETGLTWGLDPIDGTRGFLSGTPTWGVLVALCDDTGPILGIIDQPYIGERFIGGLGLADYSGPHGAQPLVTRDTAALDDSILFSTFPEIGTPPERQAFDALAGQVRLTRYGMDCYAYALLAAGQIDLVVEAGLHPYDIQAPIAVIEAAGGLVTDWQGNSAANGGRVVAAANRALHAQALAILSQTPA